MELAQILQNIEEITKPIDNATYNIEWEHKALLKSNKHNLNPEKLHNLTLRVFNLCDSIKVARNRLTEARNELKGMEGNANLDDGGVSLTAYLDTARHNLQHLSASCKDMALMYGIDLDVLCGDILDVNNDISSYLFEGIVLDRS